MTANNVITSVFLELLVVYLVLLIMVIADIYLQVTVVIVCFIVLQGFRLMTRIGCSLRNVSDNLGVDVTQT